jgi:uncharacterized membrane protein YgcG
MNTLTSASQIIPAAQSIPSPAKVSRKPHKRFQKARATLVMLTISATTMLYVSSSAWLQVQQLNAASTQNSFTSTGQSSNSFSSSQTDTSSTDQSGSGFSNSGFSSGKSGG